MSYRVRHMFRDPDSGVFFTRANEDLVSKTLSDKKIKKYMDRGYLAENAENPKYTPLAGVNFASDEAAQLANKHGVTGNKLRGLGKGSGQDGAFTADDVRKAGNISK